MRQRRGRGGVNKNMKCTAKVLEELEVLEHVRVLEELVLVLVMLKK